MRDIKQMKKRKSAHRLKGIVIVSLLATTLTPFSAYAIGDMAGWAVFGRQMEQMEATAKQAEARYNQLKQQFDVLNQQVSVMKNIKAESEGSYGMGGLLNSNQDLQKREWSPSSWQSTLKGLSGGNPARYQELVNTYKADHPTLSSSDYQKGASAANAKTYSQDIQVNRAAMVNSTYAFNNIKTHLDDIHQLSNQIDSTKNIKAAMDLNSRLVAELAYIQTQELKMQVVMNQQTAQSNADNIAAKTANAKFDALPTH